MYRIRQAVGNRTEPVLGHCPMVCCYRTGSWIPCLASVDNRNDLLSFSMQFLLDYSLVLGRQWPARMFLYDFCGSRVLVSFYHESLTLSYTELLIFTTSLLLSSFSVPLLSFNAASQNQCRMESGAWFSMAATVSYLILAILCTSIDPYVGYSTRVCCFVVTKDCRREDRQGVESGDVESNHDKLNAEMSISSDGRNWRDIVEDDDEDEELDGSNMPAVNSSFSGLNVKSSEESRDEEDVTQSSSMLQSPDTGALNSESLESDNHPTLTQSESDVLLNRNENHSFLSDNQEATTSTYKHSFPRKPDFLDVCCAGDPLEVEKHLEYPSKRQKN
jgi:hypothetical protein